MLLAVAGGPGGGFGGGRCGAWGRTVLDRTDFAKEAKSILEG